MAKKKTAKKAKPAPKKKPAKSAAGKKPAKAAKKAPSLGRPTVGIDEPLYLFFHDDFGARQIFEFLKAQTVRDLETWSPEEIVRLLSAPLRQSVDRIRLHMAKHNRSLKGDEEYAVKHRE
jgi:hypothetical protein